MSGGLQAGPPVCNSLHTRSIVCNHFERAALHAEWHEGTLCCEHAAVDQLLSMDRKKHLIATGLLLGTLYLVWPNSESPAPPRMAAGIESLYVDVGGTRTHTLQINPAAHKGGCGRRRSAPPPLSDAPSRYFH